MPANKKKLTIPIRDDGIFFQHPHKFKTENSKYSDRADVTTYLNTLSLNGKRGGGGGGGGSVNVNVHVRCVQRPNFVAARLSNNK